MDATRRAIQAAAMRCLAEAPYDDVTVGAIAAAAGVSARTVYRYYPTKESIVVEPWPEEHEHLMDALWTRPASEPPLESVRAVVAELFGEVVATDDDCRRVTLVAAHPALRAAYLARIERFERAIARWAATRGHVPRDGIDAAMFGAAVAATHRVVIDRWAGAERGRPYAAVVLAALAAIADGPLRFR